MKALKHIGGILLATLDVTVVVGTIALLFEPDPEIPQWGVGVMFFLLGVLPLGGAFALLRPTLTAPGKSCPQYGGNDRQAAGVLRSSHNWWIFYSCGWVFSSLWGASRQRQVRCTQCDALYLTDTRGTRIAGVLLWVFLLLVIFAVIGQQLGSQ